MPNITLRPYQEDCINAMFASMKNGVENSLIAMPTGSGKTIIFSRFVQKVFEMVGNSRRVRICILAHREKLVGQAYKKLLNIWPDSINRLGLACASYNKDVDIHSEIIIGSIYTVMSRIKKNEIEPFHIILIDEGHRLPAKNKESLYKKFIELNREKNPLCKVHAFTATPYQMGHGFMYGSEHKPGNTNWFKDITYSVPMKNMIDQQFLSPYRIKQAVNIGSELRSVPLNTKGDYDTTILGSIMCQFIQSGVQAYIHYGEGRTRCAAFCVNIAHAEAVAAAFNAQGIPAAAVHSKLDDRTKERYFLDFSERRLNILCSVDSISEGWDETSVDIILAMRPTKSPTIYVQQVGRGLRLHEGKKDLLILDMADHVRNHGFPDDPVVVVPGRGKKKDPPVKICPQCQNALHLSVMTCPECQYAFVKKVYKEPTELILEEISNQKVSYSRARPTLAKIQKIFFKKELSYTMMVITYVCPLTGKNQNCNVFIQNKELSYKLFEDRWFALTNTKKVPHNQDELIACCQQITFPKFAYFHKDNKKGERWPNLYGWKHEKWAAIIPEPDYVINDNVFAGRLGSLPTGPRQTMVDISKYVKKAI